MRKVFEIGGLVAAVVLIAFGIGAIVMGAQGKNTVKTNLREQKIVGTPDMTPAGITAEATKSGLDVSHSDDPRRAPSRTRPLKDGSTARCFAQYMKIHALEATGGQLYSQMPRYATADGKGTDVESSGPESRRQARRQPGREVWIQETASRRR